MGITEMSEQMKRSKKAVRNRAVRLKITVAKARNQGLGLKVERRHGNQS
jgi:hypothetical protein